MVFDDGGEVWLGPGVDRVRFADGWLDLAAEGPAARAAALHRAVSGEHADGVALAPTVAALRAGAGWAEVAEDLLDETPALAVLDDAAFVRALLRSSLGTDPAAADLSLHTGRLASGDASRAQVAVDIALSPAAMARLAADTAPAAGHWVADPFDADSGLPVRLALEDTAPVTIVAADPSAGATWFM